ncbi:NAD/NADP-dependent octopine/nopaline dehydrogenase family protein [Limobrevibacterium gyesilva]|uniref:NAD/NADP octopine/nopaline dehydrogenase family protein n=1 Tax=Limobrevibacterium gyesilva TaxID=2991712 RepID=A0AA42CG02_9PROT|nr:NAD/NADP octopine/nopaline dehydrogenase family protein [Limobrevibacterium gyesilva]
MEIAVVGGSNGGYAAAADLADAGHGVRFWRRDAAAFAPVVETQSIDLLDARGERTVKLALASTDLGAVVRGAALIVAPLPAFGQDALARALAPHLADGQVVFLPPGSFGTLVMDRARRAAGSTAEVAFAEAGTLPYLTRKHGPRRVAIRVRATRLPTGVHPARLSDHAFAVLGRAYPAVERLRDGLDGALVNAGPIIHPPLIVMNAGPLAHFDRWDIHNEGTQPTIRRVTDALDAERVAVRAALGYGAPHYPLADHYRSDGEEWMYGRKGHERLVDSADWREKIDLMTHRYMREDVACGLALLVSLAEWAGVKAPVATGLLAVASAAVGEDFRRSGRTLEALGLAGLDRAAMARLLAEGDVA